MTEDAMFHGQRPLSLQPHLVVTPHSMLSPRSVTPHSLLTTINVMKHPAYLVAHMHLPPLELGNLRSRPPIGRGNHLIRSLTFNTIVGPAGHDFHREPRNPPHSLLTTRLTRTPLLSFNLVLQHRLQDVHAPCPSLFRRSTLPEAVEYRFSGPVVTDTACLRNHNINPTPPLVDSHRSMPGQPDQPSFLPNPLPIPGVVPTEFVVQR
jgi:hypothetical protein